MADSPYDLVRKFVAQRRHEIGLNQYDLAAAAGVSKGLVSMLEAGRSPNLPKSSSLYKLALGLRADPEILLRLSQGRADLFVLDDNGVQRLIPPGNPDHINHLGRPIFAGGPSRPEPAEDLPAVIIEAERIVVTTDEYVGLPFCGHVGAGSFLLLSDHPTENRQVPKGLAEDGDAVVEVQGDSMTLAGIYPGMNLVVRKQDHADPGDIVLASALHYGTVVKRLEKREDAAYLISLSNTYYPPIKVDDEVQIVGVAMHAFIVRRLKS